MTSPQKLQSTFSASSSPAGSIGSSTSSPSSSRIARPPSEPSSACDLRDARLVAECLREREAAHWRWATDDRGLLPLTSPPDALRPCVAAARRRSKSSLSLLLPASTDWRCSNCRAALEMRNEDRSARDRRLMASAKAGDDGEWFSSGEPAGVDRGGVAGVDGPFRVTAVKGPSSS